MACRERTGIDEIDFPAVPNEKRRPAVSADPANN